MSTTATTAAAAAASEKPVPKIGGTKTNSRVSKLATQQNGLSKMLKFETGSEPAAQDIVVSFHDSEIVHKVPGLVKIERCRFLPVGGKAIEPLHWVETKPRFFVPDGSAFSESDKKFRECKVAMLQVSSALARPYPSL
jgi:hypothetical protein